MRWITTARVEAINQAEVGKTSEAYLLRSADLLAGAVARPQSLHEYEGVQDIITLGVRLMVAIGQNHCFEQGNKRTAFIAGILFIELNGIFLDLPDTTLNAEILEKTITGKQSEADLILILNKRIL